MAHSQPKRGRFLNHYVQLRDGSIEKAYGESRREEKRKPKIKDRRQSERFKKAARELGADQESSAFDLILGEMGRQKDETHKKDKKD